MILSVSMTKENNLEVLADLIVASNVSSADDVRAVVTLAESSLCPGSNIDVYRDGLFWEAEIISVSRDWFQYRFLHTGKRCSDGWVQRRHFMASWRFPVRVQRDVWKAELIANSVFHG